jgi:hypothetical protein
VLSRVPRAERFARLNAVARRIPVAVVLLLALASVSGCATTFLYDRADRLANRWIEGYVDLEPGQQATLSAHLGELHSWHREVQLPAYAAWLRTTAARLGEDRPFTEAELRAGGEALGYFWREFAGEAWPLMQALGTELDEQQVSGLLANLREEQARELRAAERRTEAWHQQRRARSMERFLRRWTGGLTAEQRAAVSAWASSLEPTRDQFYANRVGWVDELEVALFQRGDPEILERAALRLFLEPSSRWPPEYEAVVQRNAERTTRFLVEFLGSLDARQRERSIDRLERLAADLEKLSRQPG